jgi:aminoglycoside 6'-N-acetyltransferase I
LRTYKKRKKYYFLAISEEHIVGFAQCGLRFDYVEGTDSSLVGYLEGIFVLEEYKKEVMRKNC